MKWLVMILFAPVGCDPCACVNECSRQYWVVDDPDQNPVSHQESSVLLADHGDHAQDCEIEEIDKSLPEGRALLLATVQDKQGTPAVTRLGDVELTLEESACSDLSQFGSVAALIEADPSVTERVCLRGSVVTETHCTQKGCGL